MPPTANESSPRYALYYAPQGGELYELGRRWLARDVLAGEDLPAPDWAGLDAQEHAGLVRAPHRYGFHGTLKPPFHLTEGCREADLLIVAEEFAPARRAFELPPLELEVIKDFIALTPSADSPALAALARACVEDFDRFRAPMSEAERARRLDSDLTPRQEELVAEYGYPYVLDEFRFHLTLTGAVAPEERDRWLALLRGFWAPVSGRPVPVDGLAVFRAPALDAAFRQIAFFPFAAD